MFQCHLSTVLSKNYAKISPTDTGTIHSYLHAHVLPRPPHEPQSFFPPKKSVPSQSAATASICAHNEMYKCRRKFKVSRNGL
jgi:hypothetical protein